MSLVPDFELGIWNAWILVLPMIVLSALLSMMLVKRESGRIQNSSLTNKEKTIFTMHHLIFLASCAYAIFLPLKLGTAWFYIGSLSYLTGMLVVVLGLLSFYTAPIDNPVTKGVYSISRNPMYVANFFTNVGITMVCLSWVFLLVTIVTIILENNIVTGEERTCLKLYGDAYREYMNRTPKWIGIPKSKKSDCMPRKKQRKKKQSEKVGIEAVVEPGVGAIYVRGKWMKKLKEMGKRKRKPKRVQRK